MAYENKDRKNESIYSQRVRAGKRRTYFFDVRETRGNDYYLTITESRKKFNEDGYDRHKLFLYKEDFNKFLKGLTEAIDYVKTELMPDFDFDVFNHEQDQEGQSAEDQSAGGESGAENAGESADQEASSESDPQSSQSEEETQQSSAAEENQETDQPATDADVPPANDGDQSHRDEHVDKW